jgi:sortase A
VGIKTVRDVGGTRVVWADAPNAAAFHQTSAYPGNSGNTVLNGHRDVLGSVFRNLNKLELGDEIVVYAGDVEYLYYVAETLVVPDAFASARQREENLRLIGYMPEERLTLITCTPIGLATHRLLIIAKPPSATAPPVP